MNSTKKKPLSGSDNAKEIVLATDPVLIHETPQGLAYSEIWLFTINRSNTPVSLEFKINGTRIPIGPIPSGNHLQDLYGGTGAITYSGDNFEAVADVPNDLSIVGWVYEVKKETKNG